MTALDQLTGVQREAVVATATSYLLDPEDLAAEWLPLLLIEEGEPATPAIEPGKVLVKDELTGDWKTIGWIEGIEFTAPDLEDDDVVPFTRYYLPTDTHTVTFTTSSAGSPI